MLALLVDHISSFLFRYVDVSAILFFGLVLIFIVFMTEHLLSLERKRNVAKYQEVSSVIKSVIEVLVVIVGGYFTYQSQWYDSFYRKHDVEIIGSTWLIEDDFSLTRLNEEVFLDYVFYSDNENIEPLKVSLKAEGGTIFCKKRLDKAYTEAMIIVTDLNYSLWDAKEHKYIDTLIGMVPLNQNFLQQDLELIENKGKLKIASAEL
ncbi:MAG: hypothetical protein Kow0027_03240 [Saprospiraceae bacterium]